MTKGPAIPHSPCDVLLFWYSEVIRNVLELLERRRQDHSPLLKIEDVLPPFAGGNAVVTLREVLEEILWEGFG